MNWYLVATEEQELGYWKIIEEVPTWVVEMLPIGTVVNKIVYDGESLYTPPVGTELKSSENIYNVGDAFNN